MNHSAAKPVYGKRDQVVVPLKKWILSGEFPSGSRLPSVRKLADLFGVSKITANFALRELEKEGLIETQPRIGIYVRKSPEPATEKRQPILEPRQLKPEMIAAELARQISRGVMKVGEALPARKALRVRFGTSYGTLKKALRIIENEGLISRHGAQFRIGPARKAGRNATQKVFALPAWSVAGGTQAIVFPRGSSFADEFEKELSQHQVSYIGRFGQERAEGRALAARSRPDTMGFLYSCSVTLIKEIAAGSQPVMEKELSRINRMGVLVVLFNVVGIQDHFPQLSFRPYKNIFPFGTNNFTLGRVSGAYLRSMGHHKVAYFSFGTDRWIFQRLDGMIREFGKSAAPENKVYPFHARFPSKSVYAFGEEHRSRKRIEQVAAFTEKVFAGSRFQKDHLALQAVGAVHTKLLLDRHHSVLSPLFEQALTHREITAWICADSTVGQAAANFLAAKKMKVPRQISLMAIDDDHVVAEYAITGCDRLFSRMGYLAAHCILGDIPIKKDRYGIVECSPLIVDRGSVGRV